MNRSCVGPFQECVGRCKFRGLPHNGVNSTPNSTAGRSPMSAQAMSDLLRERKEELRRQAHASRQALSNKDKLSQIICRKFAELPEYAAAGTVMFYVDVRAEVRTRHYLPAVLAHGKRIVIPYCVEGALELFHLE